MKKIKFRAWDKEKKEMIFLKQNFSYADFKNFVLMQFIGFKDTKGKEIFEGDIVKGYWGLTSEIFQIIFNDDCASFDGELSNGEPVVFDDYSTMEVIGNIYENKELLN